MRTPEELRNYVLGRNEYVVVTFVNGTQIAIVRPVGDNSENTFILQQWNNGSYLPLSERPVGFREDYYSWASDVRYNIYNILDTYCARQDNYNMDDIEEISQVMKIDDSIPEYLETKFIHPNYGTK